MVSLHHGHQPGEEKSIRLLQHRSASSDLLTVRILLLDRSGKSAIYLTASV